MSYLSLREECQKRKEEEHFREREYRGRDSGDMSRDRFGRDHSRERDFSRDYSRDRESRGPSGHTNSQDPKSLMSRVFIGNLPHDKVSREELMDMFSKYGRVLAVNILKGFGFIQYDNEEDARKAVSMENGGVLKGQRVDVKMAAEGRKQKQIGDSPVGRGRPPFRESFSESGGPGGQQYRDRSPVRDRYADAYERPPQRESYPDPYKRAPPAGRDPYADPYRRESYAPPPVADTYRDPYAARDYPTPPSRVSHASIPPKPSKPPVDCEVTVLTTAQREYAETIDRRLKANGMLTFVNVLPSEDLLTKAQDDISKRGIPFNIVISSVNEQHRSITLRILYGTPQEHRNMPLEDALMLVSRNFQAYLSAQREKAFIASAGTGPEDFIPPDKDTSYLLNLLADNRFLTVDELNKVLRYITDRRDRLVGKPSGAAKIQESGKEEAALAQQQQELQAKILSVLGSDAGTATSAVTPAALQQLTSYGNTSIGLETNGTMANALGGGTGMTNATLQQGTTSTAGATAGLNFDNPNVQQALDNLISSSGSILQNLSSGTAVPTQTATANSQASLYQGYGYTGY